MALLTSSDLEAKLGRSLTANETTLFNMVNIANQTYVEKLLGTSVESESASTRYYDGGVQHLVIDPCMTITALKYVDNDQATVETLDLSDYVLDPINSDVKTQITARYGRFVNGWSNIGVTATFSIYDDTDTLNFVKNAMLDALASEINDSDSIIKESIEGYSVERAKAETKNALDKLGMLFNTII